MERILREQAEAARYLRDPQACIDYAEANGCTPEQARAGALLGASDWLAEEVLERRDYSRPIAVDLFTGLHGWARGLTAAGWQVIGFDLHDMCAEVGMPRPERVRLVLQDVATISGFPMRGKVDLIVASPPCTEFSYMAMPWKRGKAIAAALRGQGEFPEGYRGSRTAEDLTALFEHCFRIAREAECPLIVENVVGAQKWVGQAKYRYGSYYLWGDVPALMPNMRKIKNTGGSWFGQRDGKPLERNDPRAMRLVDGHYVNAEQAGGWNHPGKMFDGVKQSGNWWHDPDSLTRRFSSRSAARREASAMIAMIPFDLAYYIGQVFYPRELRRCS